MTYDVFVSYSHKDKPIADAVVAGIEQKGVRCWIAPRDLTPGTSWGDAIMVAIEASRILVVILSKNSNQSRQVVREVERAVAHGVIIIPFRIEEIDPTGAMAYFLSSEHWLDAITPPLEKHIEKLGSTIQFFLRSERVEAAREKLRVYAWDEALEELSEVPDGFMDAARLREEAERELQRHRALQQARASYASVQVLELLADVPSDYPGADELRAWAEQNLRIREQLEQARKRYDFQEVLDIAEDLPDDYPHKDAWRDWARYGAKQSEEIKAACEGNDLDRAKALLRALPSDHPEKKRLRQWVETEQARRATLVSRRGEDRRGDELLEPIKTEKEIDHRVLEAADEAEAAYAAGQWETALKRFDEALDLQPERGDLRARRDAIEAERERWRLLQEAKQALESDRWTEVLDILSGFADDDTEAEALRGAARAGRLHELHIRAEAAEANAEWGEAIAAVETLRQLQGSEKGLERWLEHLRREQEVATAAEEVRDAIERKRWQEAQAAAETAQQRFPTRDEFPSLLKKAREGREAGQQLRRQRVRVAAAAMVALILIGGGSFLWGVLGGGGPAGSLFWTPTPTATLTPSPSATPTQTGTPTPTTTPTSSPTRTPTPRATDTPTVAPTSTPTPPARTAAATPEPRSTTPELTAPSRGETYQSPVMFQWTGSLNAGQAYRVTAYHTESGHALQSGPVAAESWAVDLPADKFGEWRWSVSVVQDGDIAAQSPEWTFWFDPHPGGGGGDDQDGPQATPTRR
ncbi:MAG: TIR domain-containing protein [Anaerolineae bacterium]